MCKQSIYFNITNIMNNKKICFKKSTGIIVVAVLALGAFLTITFKLITTSTSTSTRAADISVEFNKCKYNESECFATSCVSKGGICTKSSCSTDKYQCKKNLTSCEKIGKHEVPSNDFALSYYQNNCKKNENKPIWNGNSEKPICYTATLVCGDVEKCNYSTCISRVNANISCLYKEVSYNICEQARIGPTPTSVPTKTPDKINGEKIPR